MMAQSVLDDGMVAYLGSLLMPPPHVQVPHSAGAPGGAAPVPHPGSSPRQPRRPGGRGGRQARRYGQQLRPAAEKRLPAAVHLCAQRRPCGRAHTQQKAQAMKTGAGVFHLVFHGTKESKVRSCRPGAEGGKGVGVRRGGKR